MPSSSVDMNDIKEMETPNKIKLVKRQRVMSEDMIESENDNFLKSTLNAVVSQYLHTSPVLTLKIQVLGKLGAGKSTLISNYVQAKRENIGRESKAFSQSSPGYTYTNENEESNHMLD